MKRILQAMLLSIMMSMPIDGAKARFNEGDIVTFVKNFHPKGADDKLLRDKDGKLYGAPDKAEVLSSEDTVFDHSHGRFVYKNKYTLKFKANGEEFKAWEDELELVSEWQNERQNPSNVSQSAPSMMIAAFVVIAFLMN